MSTSMQSSALLSSLSTSEHHSDSTESHESHPEQESGVIYRVKTALAARFGFFSPGSLKTVSTFINIVPTDVVCMFFPTSCISRKLSPIDCLTANTFYQFVSPVIRDWGPFSCRKRFLVPFDYLPYMFDSFRMELNTWHTTQSPGGLKVSRKWPWDMYYVRRGFLKSTGL
jgi:hypothetical protein